jgi:hypothetical protein
MNFPISRACTLSFVVSHLSAITDADSVLKLFSNSRFGSFLTLSRKSERARAPDFLTLEPDDDEDLRGLLLRAGDLATSLPRDHLVLLIVVFGGFVFEVFRVEKERKNQRF